jgi:hypothetical protein
LFDKSICFQGRTFFCIVWLILTFFKGFLKFWRKDQTHTDRQSAHCLFVIERERVTGDLEMNSFWFSFSFPLSLCSLLFSTSSPYFFFFLFFFFFSRFWFDIELYTGFSRPISKNCFIISFASPFHFNKNKKTIEFDVRSTRK